MRPMFLYFFLTNSRRNLYPKQILIHKLEIDKRGNLGRLAELLISPAELKLIKSSCPHWPTSVRITYTQTWFFVDVSRKSLYPKMREIDKMWHSSRLFSSLLPPLASSSASCFGKKNHSCTSVANPQDTISSPIMPIIMPSSSTAIIS